ncbi:unnamed protein product [Protopolystoma xenopodis]|uniref:Uncharacterized protein n=1 Tax=Protopolystoma xenopodis TaxID=117903 RepID=A0A3S5AG99_9PLAT|nr:unnamed protein product [Protopolystoma xenopodis]
MFGIINVIGSIATVFPDQSYWQASTAAKPLEGVFGILAGAMIWFIIPYAFGTICGLGYLGLGVLNGTDLLTSNDVNDG